MRLWLFIVIAGLAACQTSSRTDKLYIPPMGPSAQLCLESCETDYQTCELKVQNEYDACRQDKAFEERVYENCLDATRGLDGQQGRCNPTGLCEAPDATPCTENFDDCYIACGGDVVPQ